MIVSNGTRKLRDEKRDVVGPISGHVDHYTSDYCLFIFPSYNPLMRPHPTLTRRSAMRRHAQTILSRARKRSSDSENQPVALMRTGLSPTTHFVSSTGQTGGAVLAEEPDGFLEDLQPAIATTEVTA